MVFGSHPWPIISSTIVRSMVRCVTSVVYCWYLLCFVIFCLCPVFVQKKDACICYVIIFVMLLFFVAYGCEIDTKTFGTESTCVEGIHGNFNKHDFLLLLLSFLG